MTTLYQHSIRVIRDNQDVGGAYVASPNFWQYGYSWLRDGSFIAYAMDLAGQYESSAAFLRWVHRTIERHAWKIERVLAGATDLTSDDFLHTRYTLDGEEVPGEWTNFQLDGYGAWLWALVEHIRLADDRTLLAEVAPSVELSIRYLEALWSRPNFDYWEEFGDEVHPSTLATLYGGLYSLSKLMPDPRIEKLSTQIAAFVHEHGIRDGHLIKYLGNNAVDTSLLVCSTPFRLFAPDDPIMVKTARLISRDLVHVGGAHRYLRDTYFGGGEWVLLSALTGWYYAECGDMAAAKACLHWIEAQADENGDLPEQVSAHMLAPEHLDEWLARWGPVAKPLLWSHAMYIILHNAIFGTEKGTA